MAVPDFSTAFYRGDAIQEVADAMITTFQELSWLKEALDTGQYTVAYAWKLKGGESKGKPVFGSAQKAGGYAGHLTGATFHVFMAADHCAKLDNYCFEAALYHQLCHCTEQEIESNDPTQFAKHVPTLRGHDAELFIDEITRFGTWSVDLVAAERTFSKQLKLDFGATEPAKKSRRQPAAIEVPEATAEGWSEGAVEDARATDAILDGQHLVADPDSPVKTPIPFEQTAKGKAAARQAQDDLEFDVRAGRS